MSEENSIENLKNSIKKLEEENLLLSQKISEFEKLEVFFIYFINFYYLRIK
jgi:hypothetical protein